MNFTGRILDAFLALEETRHFSQAAQRCHMSPSAFSQMIARLEERVGARLFDRDTRNVSLTAEGEIFLQGAQRVVTHMKSTMLELADRAQIRTGRVSLSAPPSVAAGWLPSRMAQFRSQYPGIQLRLSDEISNKCLDLISRGEVDFGLSAQPGEDLDLSAELLFEERPYFICRHDHPLAQRSSVSIKDLRDQPYIHTVRLGVWQSLLALLAEAKVRDSGFEVNQLGTLAGLITAGFGVSIVPLCALELCRREHLVGVPLSAKNISRPIYIVRRRGKSLSVAAETLFEILRRSTDVADLS